MMRTLARFLLLVAAVNSGHALASEDPVLSVAAIVPPSMVVPASRVVAEPNWQDFDIGASGSVIIAGGASIWLGTTRPPRDGGSIALPGGGQIVLTNSGGIGISGGGSIASAAFVAPAGGDALIASSVPEPAAPAMLLAGLGLLAVVRRKSTRCPPSQMSHGGHESTAA